MSKIKMIPSVNNVNQRANEWFKPLIFITVLFITVCFSVIHYHNSQRISAEQATIIKHLVKLVSDIEARPTHTVYAEIRNTFNKSSYKNLKISEYHKIYQELQKRARI